MNLTNSDIIIVPSAPSGIRPVRSACCDCDTNGTGGKDGCGMGKDWTCWGTGGDGCGVGATVNGGRVGAASIGMSTGDEIGSTGTGGL